MAVNEDVSAFQVPEGWTLEKVTDGLLLSTPSPERFMATLDFERRVFRLGFSTYGRHVSTKRYKGRGWKQQLVSDAVVWLTSVMRKQ